VSEKAPNESILKKRFFAFIYQTFLAVRFFTKEETLTHYRNV